MEPNDELLSAYLDDELSDAERIQVEQRLETDDAYRRRYEDYQGMREAVQKLPRHRLDDDFAKRIVNLIETKRATPEQATTELSPDASKPAPRRLVGRIFPWAVASLAAGVVCALLLPALRDTKSGLATRTTAPDGEEVSRAEFASTDESGSELVLSAPGSPVGPEIVAFDAEKVADDVISVELSSGRDAQRAPRLGVVLNESEKEQIGQKAAGISVEGSIEIDELAEKKTDETRGKQGLGQFDYVVTATNVNHFQLRAALKRQEIVSASAPINLRRRSTSTLYKSTRQLSPTSGDATAARSRAATTPKAASATARGVAGRAARGLDRKDGERFRSEAHSLAGAVEQDAATEYVLVEASQQRILAVLHDLNQSGHRIELLPKKPAGTDWEYPNTSAGEFWYRELADEDDLKRKRLSEQRPTAGDLAPAAPDAAKDEALAAKSARKLAETRKSFKQNDTNRDSDLYADGIPGPEQQLRQQTQKRFAAPGNEPAQQYFSMEGLEQNFGRIAGGAEDRVRVLFVVGTSQSSGTPEDKSPAQPARQ